MVPGNPEIALFFSQRVWGACCRYEAAKKKAEEKGGPPTNRGKPGETMFNKPGAFTKFYNLLALWIQISSASVERLFSTGGNVVTKKRCSMAPSTMEALILVHDNRGLLKNWLA
jgi:hypothetical protein